MQSTETPSNPAPLVPPQPEPIKMSTRRFGELDHTELVKLLDSLDDDRSRSRFRESIYLSVIFYLALAWLLLFGPKYVFRTGRIVPSAAEIREKDRVTQLEMNRDLSKLQKPAVPKAAPKIDRKMLEELKAMQRASEAAREARREAAPAAPKPQPQAAPAAPAAAPQVAQNQPPLPSAPVPQPPLPQRPAQQSSGIPDSPRPTLPSVSSTVEDAGRAAVRNRMSGRQVEGSGAKVGQQGAGTGVEILSDTRGVDFTDYIKRLLRAVKAAWLPLIPEECYPPLSKEGTTLIRFTIEPNGVVSAMHLDDSTHDRAIDKAAWGGITGVGQFGPLPKEYKGQNLELRIQFIISRNASDAQ